MNKTVIITALIICVFLGYARELMPHSQTVGFLYNDLRIDSQWYWFILFKDLRSVLLIWMAWYLIPKKESVLKLGSSIFAVMITMVPINFVLFYSAPFHSIAFLIKLIVSVLVAFLINYFSNESNGNNSNYNN